MRVCLTLVALSAAAGICQPVAAEDKPTGDFARIELRGKLGKGPTTELTADKYAVRVEGKSQSFILIFPDEATRKAAKDLLGEFVVVTGELDFKEGDSGKRFASIIPFPFVTVKSLKKAEPLPKK